MRYFIGLPFNSLGTVNVKHKEASPNINNLGSPHSVLTGCVIIFEMPVTPSLFIKSSIYTCRTDMCQIIKHLHQKVSGQIDLLKSYMNRIFKLLE